MLDSSFSHSSNQSSAHFLSTVLKLFPESNHFLAVPLRLPNCLHLSLGLNDTCAFTLTPYIPYTVVNSASWGIWWKSELDCICLCSEIFRGFPSPPLEAKSLGRPRGFLWPFQCSHLHSFSPSCTGFLTLSGMFLPQDHCPYSFLNLPPWLTLTFFQSLPKGSCQRGPLWPPWCILYPYPYPSLSIYLPPVLLFLSSKKNFLYILFC